MQDQKHNITKCHTIATTTVMIQFLYHTN